MPEHGQIIQSITPLLYSEDETRRALLLISHAMGEIIIQFERIEKERETLQHLICTEGASKFNADRNMQEQYLESQNLLFADVHFLFVSLKRLKTCFDRIAKHYLHDAEFKELKNRYSNLLRQINHFRNCIEHIDQEADRGVKNLYQINVGDSCSFVFDGKEINIGFSLREEVTQFHRDLISAIRAINEKRRRI